MAPTATTDTFPIPSMAETSHSTRRKNTAPAGSSAMDSTRRTEPVPMKKGPWTAEEDEVLLDYVRRYGPRDWSTIRNKGLLPRTGKSCRLRYVNKLKPNLKSGCKFTAEEERVVISLQAEIGNKWAKIATYLPGRTDNDVKNFWSTRRKRLARMLQSPHKSAKNKAKMQPSCFIEPSNHGASSSGVSSRQPLLIEQPQSMKMVQMPSLPLYNELPASMVDLPLLPESHDFMPGLVDPSGMDLFGCPPGGMPEAGLDLPDDLTMFDAPEVVDRKGMMKVEGSFFDDLPADMFDCIEPIHNPSSQFPNVSGRQ